MSRLRIALAVVVALASTACYRVTVVTSPTASSATPTVTVPWAHSFILGLVPPQPVNVSQQCPGGNVQKVVTERSLVNGVAAWLTGSIYTPLQIQVACAGGRSSSLGLPPSVLGQPAEVAPAPADTAASR